MKKSVLQPANVLLPKQGVDMSLWAILACDQFTSQPAYWQNAEQLVQNNPSTLHIILPEVYLGKEGEEEKITSIHQTMQSYRSGVLQNLGKGFVYVERHLSGGRIRQGIVGVVDLEEYSYQKGAQARIRPSEKTVEDRIPPRLAVRRGAVLESPHILMLADDPQKTVIEPFAAQKDSIKKLYSINLMLEGGLVEGWWIEDEKQIQALTTALDTLEAGFAAKYGPEVTPFALAVGDGNHSLATAKAYWEEQKKSLSDAEKQNHPARYCLVELENIQSHAIEIEPIHRVVFGISPPQLAQQLKDFAVAKGAQETDAQQAEQSFVITGVQQDINVHLTASPWPIPVGTLEAFLDELVQTNTKLTVDYIHGEDSTRELSGENAAGILLPAFQKSDLFRGVALGGVLPRKSFSMGEATEKRYYLECRAIQD